MSRELGRVLLVTPDYPPPPGGIQTITKNLEVGLEEAGFEVRVLHVDPDDYERRLGDIVPRKRWVYSKRALLTARYVYLNSVYRQSKESIREFDPDIIHSMHIRCWPAQVAASEAGVPTVLSTYALELGEKELAERAIRAADTIHAISRFTANLVEKGVDSGVSIDLIPPSIDTEAYQKTARRVEKSDRAPVVTLARFVDRKNIQTVIRAWKHLPAADRKNRELIVAGDGPNKNELKDIADNDPSIVFPGWVNGEEKRELLASAGVFVMVPGRDDYDVEGFGIVYIEAQAAGTPVVGSHHGGAPEAIDGAGIIVDDEHDAEEVASAIHTLLEEGEARSDCLRAATERIDDFSIETVTNEHISVYKRLRNK